MSRGLDHVVHAMHDLDAAVLLYRRMGFTVGARNRHSWGTHNNIVQFPGFFVELLTFAEPDKLGNDGFSRLFSAFNRDFLSHREGLSIAMLQSDDAKADASDFHRADIAASDVMRFEREGKRPDGSPMKVAFSLAFARDAGAPEIGFAVCQQHHPENFWNEAFQLHRNTVTGIAGLVAVAENPTDHHIFLSAFTGNRDLHSNSAGISVTTERGEIQIMDPSAYRDHFGVDAPPLRNGPLLAALRFKTKDIPNAIGVFDEGEISHATRMGRVIVPPSVAMGATLVFEAI